MEFKNKEYGRFCSLLFFLVLAIFSFASSPLVTAQLSSKSDEIHAGITPDNPLLCNLEKFTEQVRLFFTFNETKKAELRLRFADERLAEIKLMLLKNNTKAAAEADKARAEDIRMIEKLSVDNKTKFMIAEALRRHISVFWKFLINHLKKQRRDYKMPLIKAQQFWRSLKIEG